MGFPVSEANSLPMNAKSLVGLAMPTCAKAIITAHGDGGSF